MRAMLLGIYFWVLGLAVSSRAQTFGEITGAIRLGDVQSGRRG